MKRNVTQPSTKAESTTKLAPIALDSINPHYDSGLLSTNKASKGEPTP